MRRCWWLIVVALGMWQAPSLVAQQVVTTRDSVEFALSTLVPLHEGITSLDVRGDSSRGAFVVARRENFNAHSSTIVTAYANAAGDAAHWDLLTFWNDATESMTLGTAEGADCALRDFRVVRLAAGGPVSVIVARRDFTASYADSEAVHFDIYQFKVNRDEEVGYPAAYFVRTRTIDARHRYCDVNAAFARELGLGMQGLFGIRFR